MWPNLYLQRAPTRNFFFIVKWSEPPSFLFSSPHLPRWLSAVAEEHPDAGIQTREQASEHWEHPAAMATRNSTRRLRGASLRLLLVSLHLLLWTHWVKKLCPWGRWKRMSEKYLKLYLASISFCLCKHCKIQYWNLRLPVTVQWHSKQTSKTARSSSCATEWAFAEVIMFKYTKYTDSAPLSADGVLFIIWWKVSQNGVRYKESIVF